MIFFKLNPDKSSLIRSLLTHKWLTPFEIASFLTVLPREFKKIEITLAEKPFVIMPSQSFDLQKCGKDFKRIFKICKKDLVHEKLHGEQLSIEGIDFLVKPFDALVWTIQKNISWPLELQEAFSIKIKPKKQLEPWKFKISFMILTQWCALLKKGASPIEILRDPLMKFYTLRLGKNRSLRQEQRDMAVVLKKREQGYQNETAKKKNKISEESLKVIPEVLKIRKNYSECNFDLLKVVIWTVAFLKTHEVLELETVRRMTLPQFIHEMMEDGVVSLYIKKAPRFIVRYIKFQIKKIYSLFPDFFGPCLVLQYNNVFFNEIAEEINEDVIGA